MSSSKKNKEIITINGHKTLIKEEEGKPIKLTVIVNNIMVSFETAKGGQNLKREHLTHVAKKMNYSALSD